MPPPASATTPTAIAGATSGTTTRLTIGDRMASRPNDTRTIGSVAACAASETPRLSASHAGTRPPPRRADPLGQRCRPGDEAGGRERRQLEAGIPDEGRVRDEQQRRRPAECRDRTSGSPGLAREQHDDRPSTRPGPPTPTPLRTPRRRRSQGWSRPTGGDGRAARSSPRSPLRRWRCSSPRSRRRG